MTLTRSTNTHPWAGIAFHVQIEETLAESFQHARARLPHVREPEFPAYPYPFRALKNFAVHRGTFATREKLAPLPDKGLTELPHTPQVAVETSGSCTRRAAVLI